MTLQLGYLVLTPEGLVESFSTTAANWLDLEGFLERLMENVRAFARSAREGAVVLLDRARVRLVRLGGGATVRFLANIEPAETRVDNLSGPLTRMQQLVAECAAGGATISQIARDIGRSQETVRTHLRQVYKRFEISNRVELAEIMRWRASGLREPPIPGIPNENGDGRTSMHRVQSSAAERCEVLSVVRPPERLDGTHYG